jgi:outer membrane biosynthesis protein TonB
VDNTVAIFLACWYGDVMPEEQTPDPPAAQAESEAGTQSEAGRSEELAALTALREDLASLRALVAPPAHPEPEAQEEEAVEEVVPEPEPEPEPEKEPVVVRYRSRLRWRTRQEA